MDASGIDPLWDAPVGFAQFDERLRYVRVNRVLAEIHGVPAADHAGKTVGEALSRPGPESAADLERVRNDGKPFETEVSRDSRHFRVSYHPVRHDARIAGVGAVVTDITDHKKNEETLRLQEQRLRLAQQISRIGTFEQDVRTGVEIWSPELEALYGLPPGSFPATREAWAALVHPDDFAAVDRSFARALETGDFEGEWRVIWPDGSVHWLSGRGFIFRDGNGAPARFLGVNIDITERKRMEEALLEADRRKDDFLGVLSHELRNPLAPIRTSIHVLKGDRSEKQAERAQAVIERQVEHLTRLVDDLLDVTRIARGKIQLRRERVDLSQIIDQTGEDHRSVMAERGIELAVDIRSREVLVDGDPTRLAQVIGNLLSNAAKFASEGGKVSLVLEARDGAAQIAVCDDGMGIEPSLLAEVFTPFVQGERTLARSGGGLGLGLALVKGLTELHGGSVAAASDGPGKGARLTVRLPLAAPAHVVARAERPAATLQPRKRCRVLVVDDNKDVAASLADLVDLFGHHAELAHDAQAALAKARANPPDFILCDIGLPGMNGYELARALRADQKLSRVYIVAVSGYAQPDDLRKAREAGFDRHLAKPADPEEIERLLESA